MRVQSVGSKDTEVGAAVDDVHLAAAVVASDSAADLSIPPVKQVEEEFVAHAIPVNPDPNYAEEEAAVVVAVVFEPAVRPILRVDR